MCLCAWPLPWLSRYLPQGDHVFGWQSVQPPAGAGVLQEQPQPLLPLQPGGYALCACIHKGKEAAILTLKTKIYVKDVESAIFAMCIGLKREGERGKCFWGIRNVRSGNYKQAEVSHARKSLIMNVCEQAWFSQGLLLWVCGCLNEDLKSIVLQWVSLCSQV